MSIDPPIATATAPEGAVPRWTTEGERILYVANSLLASLQLSFLKPLQPFVDAGQIVSDVLTEQDLREQFKKNEDGPDAASWVRERVVAFAPTLIVLCRYSGPHADVLVKWAKENAVPTIFHIDDDLLRIPAETGASKAAMHNQPARLATVRYLLDQSTLVYCSTRNLRETFFGGVETPRTLSGEIYCAHRVLAEPVIDGPVVIGYMGTSGHGNDFQLAAPSIVAALERYSGVRFSLFGSIELPASFTPYLDRVDLVPPVQDYAEFMGHLASLRWSIAVCPLTRSHFNLMKADTKWVEYSASGFAVVASSGTVYDRCCGEGCGLLVDGDDEWFRALSHLIEDQDARLTMIARAQEKLQRHYSPDTLVRQIADVFNRAHALMNVSAVKGRSFENATRPAALGNVEDRRRRIIVVVPDTHKQTAGVRIRYDRLTGSVHGFVISVQSFEDLTEDDYAAADVFIFSKTYNTTAPLVAERLRQIGKIVGIDMFDDYFSQRRDARLLRFRDWFRASQANFDFALCSTEVMQRVVHSFAPDMPVLVLPDSNPALDTDRLRSLLSDKMAALRASGVMKVLWFGIGSNPFFAAGLSDLSAYAGYLARLARGGLSVSLTIMTDAKSLTPDNLARLSRLPVPYRIVPWSVTGEADALKEAYLAFIPVNGQAFSRAKSLNRALTAISGGAQLLSPGFPLYAQLRDFVYDTPEEVLADIEQGRARVNADMLDEVDRRFDEVSDTARLAGSLSRFLASQLESQTTLRNQAGRDALPILPEIGVLCAQPPDLGTVSAARAAGILFIKAPFSREAQIYDICIEHMQGSEVQIWIRPELLALVSFRYRTACSAPTKHSKQLMRLIDAPGAQTLCRPPLLPPEDLLGLLSETAAYGGFIGQLQDLLGRVFPTVKVTFSDASVTARQAVLSTRSVA